MDPDILKTLPKKHGHNQIKICVSGAAETGHCGIDAYDKAKALGHEIAAQGLVLVTGATTGFPLWVAMGVKEAGGISIGFSPAASEKEHVDVYKLPLDYHDVIIYTGFGYSGRNLLLTRASDAVLFTCGRMGTLNEFTIAFEDNKPIGILTGLGGTTDEIKGLLEIAHRGMGKVIFDSDPKNLVERVLKLVKKEKVVEI